MRINRTRRVARAALLAATVILVIGAPTFAGKPGGHAGGGTTTSNFRVDDGAFATTTTAYRGSTGATWVHAKCSQNGKLVYEQYVSYGGGSTATLTLGPTPSWSSGSATCTGEEGYWSGGTRWRVLGTDAFAAAG